MKEVFVPYLTAKALIEEGDVLLFRGTGWASEIIKKAGGGIHSHAGLASWNRDLLECIEFREFKGGRTVNLDTQISLANIDVFRPVPEYHYWQLTQKNTWTHIYKDWKSNRTKATQVMRAMTGLPYGWKRIWLMVKKRIFLLRLTHKYSTDDEQISNIYPVCSTAVCTTLRSVYADPVPCKPDCFVEPADLARSALLNYLFTIGV